MRFAALILAVFLAVAAAQSEITTTVQVQVTTTADPVIATTLSPVVTTTTGFEIQTITIPDNVPSSTSVPTDGGGGPNPGNGTTGWKNNCSGRDMPDDGFISVNAAKKLMADYCETMDETNAIRPGTGIVWRSEKAQVYVCNYGDKSWGSPILCSKGMYDQLEPTIDNDCSPGGGGWVRIQEAGGAEYSVGRDPRHDIVHDGMEIRECGF